MPTLSYQHGHIAGCCDVATKITAGRTTVGRYFLDLPAVSATGSNVQVTAHGPGSAYCKVVRWDGDESHARAEVACFGPSGLPADTRFVIVYTDDKIMVV
ncbi:hypothetical protein [Sorangium sp. So ce131]|uniref:hypothetical protein n=1 Tax=Sorangium sp. So ce131 TaxID=3133282 RepID=UPI003F633EC4